MSKKLYINTGILKKGTNMARIDKIDYSAWTESELKILAKKADTDGKPGLQGQEIFEFGRAAIENHIDKDDFLAQLGLSIPKLTLKANAAQKSESAEAAPGNKSSNPIFDSAVNYYNDNMSYSQRGDVTRRTYDNLETRLYNMEKAIDNAFIDCAAYQDIVIMPRWHYRFYPYWEDKLINFDLEELRTTTSRDMASLHELKDKAERIFENANGITEHTEPEKTEYDVEALAKKHLGMSYSEFEKKYKNELEFCKTVTYADLTSMTETQRMVYAKAKAYAKEMLQTTTDEAHKVNWDIGERKLEETMKATESMYVISDFEFDGITEEGLSQIESRIMYKAFEDALIGKYIELDPTGVSSTKKARTINKPISGLVNGAILIFHPNGAVYDESGRRIK